MKGRRRVVDRISQRVDHECQRWLRNRDRKVSLGTVLIALALLTVLEGGAS